MEDSNYKEDFQYDWKLMMFHQERPVVQPLCGEILCGMNDFIEGFKYLAQNNFNTTCAIP